MCGRTACTLAPEQVVEACGHMNASGQWVYPQWQDAPGGQKYYQSYNLAPSLHSPVLFSSTHVRDARLESSEPKIVESDWVVQPMHWGLIPKWHHGDYKSFEYKMSNARSDGLLNKQSFKKPLETGQRCVVLADGYFEWKTSKDGKKQPFFIYFPTEDKKEMAQDLSHIKSELVDTSSEGNKLEIKEGLEEKNLDAHKLTDSKVKESNEELKEILEVKHSFGVCNEKRILTMAGLFDVWTGTNGDKLFSYSVITVDAHPDIEFIHDRMPAILNGEEEVHKWLDCGYPLNEALKLIRPTNCLKYHPVSSAVNDSRYKSPDCVKEIDLTSVTPKKLSASGNFMKSWLKAGVGEEKRPLEKLVGEDHEMPEKKLKA